jgi:hypothetical protein
VASGPGRAARADTTLRPAALAREEIVARYREVRGLTELLCEPLQPEDGVVQSMPRWPASR